MSSTALRHCIRLHDTRMLSKASNYSVCFLCTLLCMCMCMHNIYVYFSLKVVCFCVSVRERRSVCVCVIHEELCTKCLCQVCKCGFYGDLLQPLPVCRRVSGEEAPIHVEYIHTYTHTSFHSEMQFVFCVLYSQFVRR